MNDAHKIYDDIKNNTGDITSIEALIDALADTKAYKGIAHQKNTIINEYKNIDKKYNMRLRLRQKLDAKKLKN
jgi:hypothetical protein